MFTDPREKFEVLYNPVQFEAATTAAARTTITATRNPFLGRNTGN
jgi:hypothetical protein